MKQHVTSRRRFFETAGAWSLRLLCGSVAFRAAAAAADGKLPFGRAVVPGACIPPGTTTEITLASILDTVVPGQSTDPDGAAGAVEACAMNLLVDDAYPFRGYADLLVGLMDSLSVAKGGEAFVALDYDARLEVLVEAQEVLPLLRLAYRAIRSAFYGGAYNGVGLSYVGYPGPNLGYRHLPEFSFRKPVCKERSDTGWMP